MKSRSLGRTGTQESELCLGCMMFGGRTDEVASFEIKDRALDSGINFLDTANVYSRGASEEFLDVHRCCTAMVSKMCQTAHVISKKVVASLKT
jgi:aryl-alcohol dehydrogenase-like predicted oxidoreductase